jgi:hypothetical protein
MRWPQHKGIFERMFLMSATITQACIAQSYELRFQSLFDESRAYAFPCDAAGLVDIDTLSAHARLNYFYARTVIGREFARPAVRVLH